MTNSRPATGLSALAAVGSRPGTQASRLPTPSQQPPASAGPRTPGPRTPTTGTPRTAGGVTPELGALAQKLILKLRSKFGDSAAHVKGQEIISQEVLAFVKRGVTVREEDLQQLECRIRARLTGQTPVANTLTQDKRAQMEGDEWSKIFQYAIAEGKELDRQQWLALKEQQKKTREILSAQMKEREDAKLAEQREEMEYAQKEQLALQQWEASEAEKRRLQHEIALKLKQEREQQLVEKNSRRANALAKIRAEEEATAAKIAYETKAELEKEEAQRLTAKKALYEFLHQNEANKAIKEQAKREAWEEDAYFQQAWRDVLDKQDRERTERLTRNLIRQEKTAAYANSGALPEYKRWIDPAITEKHFKEREARLLKEEQEKNERQRQQELAVAAYLKEQMREREATQEAVRRQDEAKAQVVLQRAKQEEQKEQSKKATREMAKTTFKQELEKQMKDNVHRKRNQPISDVERALNRELLAKTEQWRQTGRIGALGA